MDVQWLNKIGHVFIGF